MSRPGDGCAPRSRLLGAPPAAGVPRGAGRAAGRGPRYRTATSASRTRPSASASPPSQAASTRNGVDTDVRSLYKHGVLRRRARQRQPGRGRQGCSITIACMSDPSCAAVRVEGNKKIKHEELEGSAQDPPEHHPRPGKGPRRRRGGEERSTRRRAISTPRSATRRRRSARTRSTSPFIDESSTGPHQRRSSSRATRTSATAS